MAFCVELSIVRDSLVGFEQDNPMIITSWHHHTGKDKKATLKCHKWVKIIALSKFRKSY